VHLSLPFHEPSQRDVTECSWPRRPLDIGCKEKVCFFREQFSCAWRRGNACDTGTDKCHTRTAFGSRCEQSVVNFINILLAVFAPIVLSQKITRPNCNLRNASKSIFVWKKGMKNVDELTPDCGPSDVGHWHTCSHTRHTRMQRSSCRRVWSLCAYPEENKLTYSVSVKSIKVIFVWALVSHLLSKMKRLKF